LSSAIEYLVPHKSQTIFINASIWRDHAQARKVG
jgi:hypothetical protein